MDKLKEKEQNPMEVKDQEDINLITKKMTLITLEEKHLRRRLPLEMECEIFKFLKLKIQRKFICGLGWAFYAMFRRKLLIKVC
jgi:hypothetical protein